MHDVISDAFKGKRTLNGTCNEAEIGQRDQPRGAASPPYAAKNVSEFRQRWWTLIAREQRAYPTPTE